MLKGGYLSARMPSRLGPAAGLVLLLLLTALPAAGPATASAWPVATEQLTSSSPSRPCARRVTTACCGSWRYTSFSGCCMARSPALSTAPPSIPVTRPGADQEARQISGFQAGRRPHPMSIRVLTTPRMRDCFYQQLLSDCI